VASGPVGRAALQNGNREVEYIDYYSELGVPQTASGEEIARAYRSKARKLHPDVNKAPEAEAQFKRLSEAHEVLKDPERRRRYDRYGAAWQQARETGSWPGGCEFHCEGSPGHTQSPFGGRRDSNGFSPFFEGLFGGSDGDAFPWRDLFGQGRAPYSGAPVDSEAVLELSLEDAVRGGQQVISLSRPGGESRSLKVTIPARVTDGQRLRLVGQGVTGPQGQRGDLYLRIRFGRHPVFRVEGLDLHTNLDVPPAVAALGGKVRLRALDKEIAIRVPAGSSSGKRIRLKGQGLPGADAEQGDLYAEVRIVVPASLAPEERALYERLADLTRRNRGVQPSAN